MEGVIHVQLVNSGDFIQTVPQVPQLRRSRDDEGTVIDNEKPLVRATGGFFHAPKCRKMQPG